MERYEFKVQYLSISSKINAHETHWLVYDYAATNVFEFQLRKWVGQRHRNSDPFPSSVIFVVYSSIYPTLSPFPLSSSSSQSYWFTCTFISLSLPSCLYSYPPAVLIILLSSSSNSPPNSLHTSLYPRSHQIILIFKLLLVHILILTLIFVFTLIFNFFLTSMFVL